MKNKIFTLIFAFIAISFMTKAQKALPGTSTGGGSVTTIHASLDIWVEDLNGNKLDNPDCSIRPNLVCVRVRNNSEYPSSYTKMTISWSAAGLTITEPQPGDGSDWTWPGGPVGGEYVDIPPLESQQEIILKIPWNVPCPEEGQANKSFCLRVGIDSKSTIVLSKNNVKAACSNVTIIRTYHLGEELQHAVYMKNYHDFDVMYGLEFVQIYDPNNPNTDPDNPERPENPDSPIEIGPSIYEKAEVFITFDERMVDIWERSNGRLEDIERVDWNKFKLLGENAKFYGLTLRPQEMVTIGVSFKFFEYNPETKYEYHLITWDLKEKKFIGSETYRIYRYDGKNIEKPINITKNTIRSISPNPTRDNVIVTYSIEENQLSYLTVTSIDSKINKKYELDPRNNEITINASDFPTGIYTVSLVCGGTIVNSSSFVKE